MSTMRHLSGTYCIVSRTICLGNETVYKNPTKQPFDATIALYQRACERNEHV
jgi:hypothetical protein